MGALSGITVLELSRVLAGPWCGMTLADLGADVIKLESFEGDDTRGLGPPFLDGMSAYFACCNRNKRSLAIDLRAPAARPLLEALVRSADVMVENYRTGGAESLGVGYEAMASINPRLVYCSISGYGRDGPGAMRPGYDYVVQAEAGLMSITGPADGEASKVGVAVADLATGQNAATAILAALLQRQRDGRGQRIDVSLFDTQLSLLANVAGNALFTGVDAPRFGNAHPSIVPYQAFAASDQSFVLAVASEKLWAQLCRALGQPGWLEDERWRNNAARVRHRDSICQVLADLFKAKPAAHWLALFERAGIPAAPINSVCQALEHPVAHARGMRYELGGIPMVGSPIRLSGSPTRRELPPPRLGEHSDLIVRAAGFEPDELRAAGAIR
ncbi:CoA transferase [Arenimonas soli]|uniref:CoA transferase n=1 Tax=Arenimonas soli TaxID=2269504 RepID=A0ABQ1HCS2_9GAMM|nr:CoA transferase [Arenimonas soli]GGA69822.1 CoA transferase [Arenimonas soli]